ncbi:MAG: ATP-binding cassette domain-containing protein [Lachnospiraceae bacterium]|nr:ATP-binding cassette domain-containing protein [Lachnospiraceae bacterium]
MGLEVKIRKKFGNFVLDVAFESKEGVLGLLGASGCGKSMTLKCIAGVVRPEEGRIVLNGRVLFDSKARIDLPPQKRRVGYLFQDYALFPDMTVERNILCGAGTKEKTEQYLKRYALEEVRKQYPAQLSGGQKQRVALARMLAAEPEAVLLDEPFSALDNFLKARMERELMSMLDGYANPVLFVSHDRNEVYRLTDTIAVMQQGQIADISEKHELFRAPKTLAATLLTGCKNVTGLKPLADGTYLARDWGIRLQGPKEGEHAGGAAKQQYVFAGFRAHYAVPVTGREAEACRKEKAARGAKPAENLLECEILREIEDTFSVVVQFYPKDLSVRTEYSLLTYETGKEEWERIRAESNGELFLRIPPEAVIWMTH